MKLVACPSCHAQYDVSSLTAEALTCRCGARVENAPQKGIDTAVARCGACGALARLEADHCDYCGSALLRDHRDLSLICPECFARNAEDGQFCTACGVRFAPEPPPETGGAQTLPCPACEARMSRHGVGGVPVHECPRCRGLWAPDESFNLLVRRAIEAYRTRGAQGALLGEGPRTSGGNPLSQGVAYRKCPVCAGLMQRRNFQRRSGVIVDWCRGHGTWLDADELESIAGYIASGGTLTRGCGPAAGATSGMGAGPGDAPGARAARTGSAGLGYRGASESVPSSSSPLGSLFQLLDALLG